MMNIRKSGDRGVADFGWLKSRHTFSFGSYHDPQHMGFGPLRVINDDIVAPGGGFDTHGHRDMEIVSYVLEGALAHKDTTGGGSVLRPGDVQRMTAGTGVRHSEFNGSDREHVHFLQIWFLPARAGLTPGYEDRTFSPATKRGRFALIGSRDGREDSLTIHQDVNLYAGLFTGTEAATLDVAQGRVAWVHVARGSLDVNGHALGAGDAVSGSDIRELRIDNAQDAEVLVFDMIA